MTSLILLGVFSSILFYFKFGFSFPFFFSLISFFFMLLNWGSSIFKEGLIGKHTYPLQSAFKVVFYYFLLSEVMFFVGMFWFFFDSALSPSSELGEEWVPKGVEPANPLGVPFLNSLILLSSAVSLTWAHHSFLSKEKPLTPLMFTIGLGFFFIGVQGVEYYFSSFSFSDSVYGSIFFMLTGFHGLHVILGVYFLILNLLRLLSNQLSMNHFLSLEFGIIYWHFVDVIWLYLYLFLYWWSF